MVELQEKFDIELDWRGFFLHPEIPKGGQSVADLFGEDRARGFVDYLQRFAANFGVPINPPSHIPNTYRALAITEYARDEANLEAFRDAAMDAYWLNGEDIEDEEVLSQLAKSAGLDPATALKASDDPKYHVRIHTDFKQAKANKVTGIPTLFIEDKMIVGCHPYSDLEKAAHKAGLISR